MKLLGIMGVLLLAATQTNAAIQERQYSLELTDPNQAMSLEIDLYNGSAQIIGYEGKTVEISAKMTPLSDAQLSTRKEHNHYRVKDVHQEKKKARSREGLTPVNNVSFNLEIEESDNVVEIESSRGSFNIELVVKVPMTAKVEVDLYDGEYITVENISSSIEVETWRGNITFINIDGPVVAESHLHDIVATFSSFDESAPSSFTTFGGDIDVTLNSGVAMKLNVRNYEGEILSGLDSEFVPVDSVDESDGRNKQKIVLGAQLSTTINNGKQLLSLSSYKGDMYLRKGH